MQFLRFVPLLQERVWGGRSLGESLGRHLPSSQPFGESWEVVDRPEAQSVVADGPLAGRRLGDLRQLETRWLMGPTWDPSSPFPILVKWLDCRDRLSLQVHPPAAVAPRLRGEPKTENWYIAEATPDAALLAGLRPGVTRADFESALASGTLEPLVHRMPVKAGDSLFVRSGRLHAIDAGNLILEIQQNSDTTYRVYDWGRVGLDGKPRALHVAESMASIDFDDFAPEPLRAAPGNRLLADSAEFKLRQEDLEPGSTLAFAPGNEPLLVSVVSGSLVDATGGEVLRGDTVLVPFATGAAFRAPGKTRVLVTSGFSRGGAR